MVSIALISARPQRTGMMILHPSCDTAVAEVAERPQGRRLFKLKFLRENQVFFAGILDNGGTHCGSLD
jgi:hypothetical protein